MNALDPLVAQWLAEQGQPATTYMQQGPLTAIPGRAFAPPQPPPQADPALARMTPANPLGGLPRPIVQPKNAALFGRYASTYQAGRQVGQEAPPPQPGEPGWGQPPPEPPPPFYLDNSGRTSPGGLMAGMQGQAPPPSPQDEFMLRNFPRSSALQQQLQRMRMLRDAQAVAAATPPPPGPAGPAGPAGKMGPRGPMGPARPPLQR